MRTSLTLRGPDTGRLRDEWGDQDPAALDEDALEVLAIAGLTLGAPMGRAQEGRHPPRRALDGDDHHVVVRVVDLPEDSSGARTLRRLAELRALRHCGLVPVRDVIALPGSRAAVITELIAGADLAVVLGARGGLTRGESAMVLDVVGSALAHLHEHGAVHGDVSPGNVMITLGGAPVLIDLLGGVLETGTESCAAPERLAGGPATPASDVYALAALLHQCAQGSTALRRRIDGVLADALDSDPQRRPTARELAARAPEVGSTSPVALPDGARLAAGALKAAAATPTRVVRRRTRRGRPGAWRPRPRGRQKEQEELEAQEAGAEKKTRRAQIKDAPTRRAGRGRRGRRDRRRLAPLVAAAAVVLAAGLIWESGGPSRLLSAVGPATGEGAAATPPGAAEAVAGAPAQGGGAPEDLVSVVVGLASARDQALEALDAQALAATTVPGSPAALADSELVESLTGAGETISGLDTSVSQVLEVETPADAAAAWPDARAVQVTLTQGPSTRTGPQGSRSVPAQAARQVVLIVVPDPWRVAEVRQP